MKVCATIVCVFIGTMLAAQPAEIVTDRPDQTESSSVVGAKVFQVETGVVFSKEHVDFFNSAGDLKTRDYATTLLRYGVSERLELRLITSYTEIESPAESIAEASGMQPLAVGVKAKVAEENGIWPEIAFIGHLTLPWIGSEDFVPEYVAPDFRFSLAHTLSERFSLGYNIGMYWDGVDPRSHFIYTIALGAGVAGPVGVFAEVFGEKAENSFWVHQLDFGATVLVTPDLQFDISYGIDLEDAENHFLSAGLSFRIGAKRQYRPVD